jgi:hypothetical protein
MNSLQLALSQKQISFLELLVQVRCGRLGVNSIVDLQQTRVPLFLSNLTVDVDQDFLEDGTESVKINENTGEILAGRFSP